MKSEHRASTNHALISTLVSALLLLSLAAGCGLFSRGSEDGEQGGSELTDEERATLEAAQAAQPGGEADGQSGAGNEGEEERGEDGLDGEEALVAGSIPLEDRFRDPTTIADLQARLGLIPPAPPMVEHLLYRADLRDVLGYAGELRVGELPGRDVTSFWNARRLAAEDGLGCIVQRWVYPSTSALNGAHEAYVASLVTPRNLNDVAEDAWLSTFATVRSVTFTHRLSTSMVQVACDEELSTDDQMIELAERVYARL